MTTSTDKDFMATRIERRLKANRTHYMNEAEDEAAKALEANGCSFTRRGYPDFTVLNSDGSIYGFVEVKPYSSHSLKRDQEAFGNLMIKNNIPFIKWSPDQGMKAIRDFLLGVT